MEDNDKESDSVIEGLRVEFQRNFLSNGLRFFETAVFSLEANIGWCLVRLDIYVIQVIRSEIRLA